MRLARETAREEKPSTFHEIMESLWPCKDMGVGMGAQRRVGRLKAERVHQSLLVTMGPCGALENRILPLGIKYAFVAVPLTVVCGSELSIA